MSRSGILFDLDGTLADTAPDLVAVLNVLLREADRPPVPFAIARNEVSNGAVGLIRLGFGLEPGTEIDPVLRQRFLDLYQSNGHSNSSLFLELSVISDICSRLGCRWGIVTNKPEALTLSLLEYLDVLPHAETVVSGDTLPQRKPDPAPLLLAAEQLGLAPGDCIYLGDAERDIVAGRAAGMRTVATTYGYLRPNQKFDSWGADAQVDHPRKIAAMLQQMIGTG